MKKSIKSVSIKNLIAAPTVDAPTTIASVEAYAKAVVKASKVKAPTKTKQVHHFAPDGVTRISASLDACLKLASPQARQIGAAIGDIKTLEGSLRATMALVWKSPIIGEEKSTIKVFRILQTLGYIPENEGSSGNEGSPFREYNLKTFGTAFHPIYKQLYASRPESIEKAKVSAVKREAKKSVATLKVASTETKGIAEPAVATDVHVKATCSKYMEMHPTPTQRAKLLEAIAATLGFKLEGFKSTDALL